jgi:exopolyphosphatase/guanosine-5'-triphosphate,3'-diphosphate pyrophosphatase
MLSASVDVGSNTLRLLIGSVRGREISRLHTARAVTRLAEGVRETGSLREENMRKSVAALKDFSRSIAGLGASPVRAVGTSALREAKNAGAFVRFAREETGIAIDVIAGTREAALTARGVVAGLPDIPGVLLIVDIGGGSTEWIVHNPASREAPACGTVPLGVVNLLEGFITADPPSGRETAALNEAIDAAFGSDGPAITPLPGFSHLVGTGGTITTLASIDLGLKEYAPARIHGHRMSLARLRQIAGRLTALPFAERQRISGIGVDRADLIIPGVLLTIRLVALFGLDGITVSDFGLLEGLLEEMQNEKSF